MPWRLTIGSALAAEGCGGSGAGKGCLEKRGEEKLLLDELKLGERCPPKICPTFLPLSLPNYFFLPGGVGVWERFSGNVGATGPLLAFTPLFIGPRTPRPSKNSS